MQEFPYVRIFKFQSLSDRVHGRFLQDVIFKVVAGRLDYVHESKNELTGSVHNSDSYPIECIQCNNIRHSPVRRDKNTITSKLNISVKDHILDTRKKCPY